MPSGNLIEILSERISTVRRSLMNGNAYFERTKRIRGRFPVSGKSWGSKEIGFESVQEIDRL